MTITASNGIASNTVFRNTNARFQNFVKSLEYSFLDCLKPHLGSGSTLDFIFTPNYSTVRFIPQSLTFTSLWKGISSGLVWAERYYQSSFKNTVPIKSIPPPPDVFPFYRPKKTSYVKVKTDFYNKFKKEIHCKTNKPNVHLVQQYSEWTLRVILQNRFWQLLADESPLCSYWYSWPLCIQSNFARQS